MPVWVLARELGVGNQVLLKACAAEGWAITSHSHNLTADQVLRLRQLFAKPTDGAAKPADEGNGKPATDADAPAVDGDAAKSTNGGDTPPPEAPTWVKIVGVVFLGLTLLFFMIAVLGGIEVRPENCFLVVAVFSLGAAIGSGFLTGDAAIRGQIPIPGLKGKPIVAGATGGVAVLLVVFLVGYLSVCHNLHVTNTVTVPADPTDMGSTTIAFDRTGPNSFDRDAIQSVEDLWDAGKTNVVQFRVTFNAGKKSGWFRAIHLNTRTKSLDSVKYYVSLRDPVRIEVTKMEAP